MAANTLTRCDAVDRALADILAVCARSDDAEPALSAAEGSATVRAIAERLHAAHGMPALELLRDELAATERRLARGQSGA
jgi:hypothetical protein